MACNSAHLKMTMQSALGFSELTFRTADKQLLQCVVGANLDGPIGCLAQKGWGDPKGEDKGEKAPHWS